LQGVGWNRLPAAGFGLRALCFAPAAQPEPFSGPAPAVLTRTDLFGSGWKIERFHNSRALSGIVQGGIFLRKMPLDGSGFGVQQLWIRCRPVRRIGAGKSALRWIFVFFAL
jgi:hypothetical protein